MTFVEQFKDRVADAVVVAVGVLAVVGIAEARHPAVLLRLAAEADLLLCGDRANSEGAALAEEPRRRRERLTPRRRFRRDVENFVADAVAERFYRRKHYRDRLADSGRRFGKQALAVFYRVIGRFYKFFLSVAQGREGENEFFFDARYFLVCVTLCVLGVAINRVEQFRVFGEKRRFGLAVLENEGFFGFQVVINEVERDLVELFFTEQKITVATQLRKVLRDRFFRKMTDNALDLLDRDVAVFVGHAVGDARDRKFQAAIFGHAGEPHFARVIRAAPRLQFAVSRRSLGHALDRRFAVGRAIVYTAADRRALAKFAHG